MNSAVIVAAGKGLRMGGAVRKQYLKLDGLPVLSHTLSVFDHCSDIDAIYLVVPKDGFSYCREHVLPPVFSKTPITLVAGGMIRQASVWNGLTAIGVCSGVVVIHDGVRPFVTTTQLSTCIREANSHKACILGIPATDTLKSVSKTGQIQQTLDRHNIWLAQTPQAFQYDLIKRAHAHAMAAGEVGTDDAMLIERIGIPVKIIPGSRNNIKITTPEDLLLAAALLKCEQQTATS